MYYNQKRTSGNKQQYNKIFHIRVQTTYKLERIIGTLKTIYIMDIQQLIKDPNVLVAIVLGFVVVYFVWQFDKRKKNHSHGDGSVGTCPAGFGSASSVSDDNNNTTDNDAQEKDSSNNDDNIGENAINNSRTDGDNIKKDEKKFTLEELKKYKYKYVGVKGVVFDVSNNEMYNQGETYSIFTGHDASRALAKMSLEIGDVANTTISDLSLSEMDVLDDWYIKFEGKYKRVGVVDFPKDAKR